MHTFRLAIMTYVSEFMNDVFISYATEDNRSVLYGGINNPGGLVLSLNYFKEH